MAVENTVGIAVISMVILGGGYLFVGALWYLMVYRPSREERRALAKPTSGPAPASVSESQQHSDRSPTRSTAPQRPRDNSDRPPLLGRKAKGRAGAQRRRS
ncbi:MAG: hypothetical protein ABI950_09925 [Solirubrobacteraceae bacterium]